MRVCLGSDARGSGLASIFSRGLDALSLVSLCTVIYLIIDLEEIWMLPVSPVCVRDAAACRLVPDCLPLTLTNLEGRR
jgi:hypothetical protein